jgi:hypothetical protein
MQKIQRSRAEARGVQVAEPFYLSTHLRSGWVRGEINPGFQAQGLVMKDKFGIAPVNLFAEHLKPYGISKLHFVEPRPNHG